MDTTQILVLLISGLLFLIIILSFFYWFLSIKNKQTSKDRKDKAVNVGGNKGTTKESAYSKLSIFDFMEFDDIEDNMIIQNGGKRYLMAIECEGINYDLMSEVEKTSVEAGFVQFLNTLRYPIQIYTQTRTINIGNSIEKYREKLKEIKTELDQKQLQLNKAMQSSTISSSQLQKLKMEVARNLNLFEYGQDIISNIEKMSLNKNVLKKHYYIIVPYNTSELGVAELGEEEKRNMIFSELYTRCQAITRTLFACSMKSRVLTSNELVDLLYVAYNRDESEIYSVDKAVKAGYTELYSTGPDVLDKKMEALNREIERRALELAQNTVEQVKSEKQLKIEDKEQRIDEITKELAEIIINENKRYIGKNVANESIERIKDTTKEKGGNADEKTKKTRTRRTTKSN